MKAAWCFFVSLSLLSACIPAPAADTLATPGHDRVAAREKRSRQTHFALRCPTGEPRLGLDCGLLAYHWYSEAHINQFAATECHGQRGAACSPKFLFQYLAAIAERYAGVSSITYAELCTKSFGREACYNPLLLETVALLAHNALRQQHPNASYDIISSQALRRLKEREQALIDELAPKLQTRLQLSRPSLPDRDCPQRALAEVACEGPARLLGWPWRKQPFHFNVLGPAPSLAPSAPLTPDRELPLTAGLR